MNGLLSKVFLGILAASIIVFLFLTYYSWTWLQSIGNPRAAAEGYLYHSFVAWPFLWLSSIVLLAIGNALLWTTRRGWAMWLTLAYFAAALIIRTFWLERSFAAFMTDNGLGETTSVLGPLLAAVLIVIAAAIVFFNQFLVLRMQEKVYGTAPSAEE